VTHHELAKEVDEWDPAIFTACELAVKALSDNSSPLNPRAMCMNCVCIGKVVIALARR
jgi:hypothetical protein